MKKESIIEEYYKFVEEKESWFIMIYRNIKEERKERIKELIKEIEKRNYEIIILIEEKDREYKEYYYMIIIRKEGNRKIESIIEGWRKEEIRGWNIKIEKMEEEEKKRRIGYILK